MKRVSLAPSGCRADFPPLSAPHCRCRSAQLGPAPGDTTGREISTRPNSPEKFISELEEIGSFHISNGSPGVTAVAVYNPNLDADKDLA